MHCERLAGWHMADFITESEQWGWVSVGLELGYGRVRGQGTGGTGIPDVLCGVITSGMLRIGVAVVRNTVSAGTIKTAYLEAGGGEYVLLLHSVSSSLYRTGARERLERS